MILRLLRSYWLLSLTLMLYLLAFMLRPERALAALHTTFTTFGSVLLLILAVFGLIGLLQVWISRDLIVRLLGRDSGIKSLLLASFCGTLLIGPAYLVFPLLMGIRKQGARWAVVAIVLTSYAVKLQMLPIESGFLGWPFTIGRAVVTLALGIPTGLLIEAVMERRSSL